MLTFIIEATQVEGCGVGSGLFSVTLLEGFMSEVDGKQLVQMILCQILFSSEGFHSMWFQHRCQLEEAGLRKHRWRWRWRLYEPSCRALCFMTQKVLEMAAFPLDSLLFLSLRVSFSLSVSFSHPLPIIAQPHAGFPKTKRGEMIKFNLAAAIKPDGGFQWAEQERR